MKKVRLAPFVHKVKGAKNYAFYDLLNNRLFRVELEGDVEVIKDHLLRNGLAYDTECVIPFKFQVDVSKYKTKITLRELQLRITGQCDMNCDKCGEFCCCYKSVGEMSMETLRSIIEQFRYIPIVSVVVTGGNPLCKIEMLSTIKKEINAESYKILTKAHEDKLAIKEVEKLGFQISSSHHWRPGLEEFNLKSDPFTFFFNQEFNPCWGNMIAIDVDGSIKPCLWVRDITLGNINQNNIKEMVSEGDCDKFWELSKNKIDTCNRCEYRNGCNDCRAEVLNSSGHINAKTLGCSYNPDSGLWE